MTPDCTNKRMLQMKGILREMIFGGEGSKCEYLMAICSPSVKTYVALARDQPRVFTPVPPRTPHKSLRHISGFMLSTT
jgi:hypothetical protein